MESLTCSLSHAFAVVDDLPSLMVAIKRRIDDLGITLETVEHLSGIPSGYLSKITGDPPMRRASPYTWFLVLQALSLKLTLTVDPPMAERMKDRYVPRKAKKPVRRETPNAVQFAPGHFKKIGSQGGLARASRLTSQQRSLSARHACEARYAGMSPEQRSATARHAACSRWQMIDQQNGAFSVAPSSGR